MRPDELAKKMPLTHFPALAVLDDGSTAPSWPAWRMLLPPAQRPGATEPADDFERIQHEHVFLYAGPACFALTHGACGDSVIYFHPGLDAELRGHATPFDTGACKPEEVGGRLQPYASQGEAECHTAIAENSVPLGEWRERLMAWLEHCYENDDCARYLQTSEDEYVDGAPVQTRPPEILDQNGSRGRASGTKCADRRAWTWELRTTGPVSFRWIKAIHVMPAAFETALRRSEELAKEHGMELPEVMVGPAKATSPRALYEDSERVLRHMLGEGT